MLSSFSSIIKSYHISYTKKINRMTDCCNKERQRSKTLSSLWEAGSLTSCKRQLNVRRVEQSAVWNRPVTPQKETETKRKNDRWVEQLHGDRKRNSVKSRLMRIAGVSSIITSAKGKRICFRSGLCVSVCVSVCKISQKVTKFLDGWGVAEGPMD